MEQHKSSFFAVFWALFGFSLVIIVHECGHFLVARFLMIACPVFSVGFGPAFISMFVGKTTFQIALIPLGGYVLVDPGQFDTASYTKQCLITVAGIFFNLIFAYFLFLLLSVKRNTNKEEEFFAIQSNRHENQPSIFRHAFSLYTYTFTHLNQLATQTFAKGREGIIGPIGILKGLIESAKDGAFLYILSIAMLNINVALFNVLPIPFLDGGKLLQVTIDHIFGKQPFSVTIAISIFLLFLIITIFSQFQKPAISEKKVETSEENQ